MCKGEQDLSSLHETRLEDCKLFKLNHRVSYGDIIQVNKIFSEFNEIKFDP